MALSPFEPTGAPPYLTVNVLLNDANSSPIDFAAGAGITVSFDVVTNTGLNIGPLNAATDPNGLSQESTTTLIEALKTWAENADWNTGVTWSSYGVTGPASFNSVSIVETTQTTTVTDVTPS